MEQHAPAHAAQQYHTSLPHAWHPAAASPTHPAHAPHDHHHHLHPLGAAPPSLAAAAGGPSGRGLRPTGALPPIHVRICQGYLPGSDLTIKISDQGGGIPPHLFDHVWSYGFTTVGGIPPGYDLPHPAAPNAPISSPYNGSSPAAAAADPHAHDAHHPHGHHHHHHHHHHLQHHHHGQHGSGGGGGGGGGSADGGVVGGRAGVFPSADAAARATQSHWHVYSPAGVASGPYAPQPLTHHHHPAGANGGGGGGVGASLSPDGTLVYHREGWGSDGMGPALMGEGPGGAAVGGGGGGGGGGGRFRIAGLGFGLPLSRLYASYFGGNLTLQVRIGGAGRDGTGWCGWWGGSCAWLFHCMQA